MEDNKNPERGGAKRRPLWGGAEGAALLSSIWQWKSGIKNLMEIVFFIKVRSNFWPRIENRLLVVLALNKKPGGALIKNRCFSFEDPIKRHTPGVLGEKYHDFPKNHPKTALLAPTVVRIDRKIAKCSKMSRSTEWGSVRPPPR